jgi:hypothetical protein
MRLGDTLDPSGYLVPHLFLLPVELRNSQQIPAIVPRQGISEILPEN